jgi:predicted nucleotidyltransferase
MLKENAKALTKDEVRKRLAPLFTDKAIELVVLFGSSVTGRLHKGSDIVFDRSVDVVDLTNRVTRMLGKDNVDVVDLRRASPLLMYAAAQKGIALYEREPGPHSS